MSSKKKACLWINIPFFNCLVENEGRLNEYLLTVHVHDKVQIRIKQD